MTVDEVPLLGRGEGGALGAARRRPGDDVAGAVPSRGDQGRGICRAGEAIRLKALPYRIYPDGMAIRIDARATYEPDAAVVCGSRAPPDAIEIDNPVIVVEVVSPNTAAIDHGRKLSGYFSHPSVQHYPILDPDRRVVIHHKRGAGDAIETRVLTGGFARLDPPGFEVAVEALFPPPDRPQSAEFEQGQSNVRHR
jgi:Putative restriction endonuclease